MERDVEVLKAREDELRTKLFDAKEFYKKKFERRTAKRVL